MPLDLLGPANAVNFTTVRPADTRIFGAVDTFFKNCTPGARDGTAVEAAWLNGVLMQIRQAVRGMGITEDNTDDDMLLKAIQTAAAGLVPEAALLASLPVHALVGAAGTLAYTSGAGTIVVSTGQSITRRGFKVYALDNISLANRTFVTLANKTYHLRWYAPGVGRATPASSWPYGRLYLEDIADLTYNPSALAETNSAFDSTYDSLILARVATDGANALTVTPLLNLPRMTGIFSRLSSKPQVNSAMTHTFNWSRLPILSLRSIWPPGGGRDTDPGVEPGLVTRYSADISSIGWSDEQVAGTHSYPPNWGYSFSIGA